MTVKFFGHRDIEDKRSVKKHYVGIDVCNGSTNFIELDIPSDAVIISVYNSFNNNKPNIVRLSHEMFKELRYAFLTYEEQQRNLVEKEQNMQDVKNGKTLREIPEL